MFDCLSGCDFPPDIAHGRFKKHKHYSTIYATYECDAGYTLVGQAKISCRSSKWSAPASKCKALCLKPEIENGQVSVNKNHYTEGENVTIQCNPGYHVTGSQSISCSENSTWYPEVSKCEWIRDTIQEVPEGCEKVLVGRKIIQCLPDPQHVKLALEVYKLSLEIEKLEQEQDEASMIYRKP
ncbi:C4b-binding protein alpha chain-like [Rhynchocyon petersi]